MTEADAVAAVEAAGALWDRPEQAEALLLKAMADAPQSETVLVALYRFYFYRSQLDKALTLAERCIERAARALAIDPDWRQVALSQADCFDFGDYALPQHRFYLFSLNAYGYLLARLGRTAESAAALSAVKRLDPRDSIGGGRLLDVVRAGPDQE